MSYERPEEPRVQEINEAPKPDRASLRTELRNVMQNLGRADLVHGGNGWIEWFTEECCSGPHQSGCEHAYQRHGKNGSTWAWPYRERLLEAARAYCRLSESDLALLHAGIEDGVKWRGEPIATYVDVVNETEIMRNMGKPAYIERCKEKIAKLQL